MIYKPRKRDKHGKLPALMAPDLIGRTKAERRRNRLKFLRKLEKAHPEAKTELDRREKNLNKVRTKPKRRG